jgi:hypothetical protein
MMEVKAVVVMNVAIFWDTAPSSQYMNRRLGGNVTFFIFRVENQPVKLLLLCSAFQIEDSSGSSSRNVVHVRRTVF